jgi:DNA-binding transcriptional regulator YiaG
MTSAKKTPKKLDLNNIAEYRRALGLNQAQFWNPIGVSQSSASRYETERDVSPPIARLLLLRHMGLVTDAALESVSKELSRQGIVDVWRK